MRNFSRVILLLFFCIALLCFGSASRVDAVPVLTLSDGTTTKFGTVVGNNAQFFGNIGVFDTNITFGTSTSPFPTLDLTSIDTSSGPSSGGVLTVDFSNDGFTRTSGPPTPWDFSGLDVTINALATTGGVVLVEYFVNNTLFGKTTGVGSNFAYAPEENVGVLPDSFSLRILATISHPASQHNVQTNFNTGINPSQNAGQFVNAPVPEPGTISLIGIGLAGLAGRRFLRRKKNKILDVDRMEG